MTVKYWTNFTKKKNSTRQPTGILANTIDVNLKEGTSVENPTFLVTGDVLECSYVQAFGSRYYFVTDIKSIRKGLTEISCRMDPLATHKTEIGNYTAFIERSASFYDTDYPDPSVSVQNSIRTAEAKTSTSGFFYSGGYFVLSVLNNVGSGTGFTTSYILDSADLEKMAQYVNIDWGNAALGVTTVVEWLQATFLKTADSIIDCVWIPISNAVYTATGAPVHNEVVVVGIDSVTVGGSPLYADRITAPFVATDSSFEITIPHIYSDFRRFAPYTYVKLCLPGYGAVDINPLDFKKNNKIKLSFSIDISTGDMFVALGNDDGHLVSTYSYNVGVSCPVGRVGSNVTASAAGILQTAAMFSNARALPSGFQFGGALSATASAVNTLSTITGVTASVNGAKGGRAAMENLDIWCSVFARDTSDPDELLAESGRVCMATHQISTCSGYVKCLNASISIDGMESERDEINAYLNDGFYYE